jgi:hypothetical protein
MLSKAWGKPVLAVTIFLAAVGPIFSVQIFNAEMAAVALITRPDSGGPILIPARCDKPGAELGKDYLILDGRAIRGRAIKRGCFYTVSAYKRFFPERFEIDNPRTYRVQQLTTDTRLLKPSTWHAFHMLAASILAPLVIFSGAMLMSMLELLRASAMAGSSPRRR